MSKFINDLVMDAALNYIKDGNTIISACGTQPTTSAEATAVTHSLGTLAYATTNFTLGNGDTSGRKITCGAATIPVLASGTVDHVAFCNTGTLFAVGTCAPTAVTSGGTIIIAAFDLDEIRDPA
jgi:hypothetical protein